MIKPLPVNVFLTMLCVLIASQWLYAQEPARPEKHSSNDSRKVEAPKNTAPKKAARETVAQDALGQETLDQETLVQETSTRIIDSHRQVQRCVLLKLNQQIKVSFSSSEPLEFFVELRSVDQRSVAQQNSENSTRVIGKQLTHKMKGLVVTAKSSGQYCFIWRNPQDKGVKITTSYHRDDKLPSAEVIQQ
ncbi:hypothetical protein [Pleionea litopenaei]|uniref:Intracellular proteinase inhibitor BsuPI n=1 Tax=Pleionea litopenaei TaxID=3070815 RepID=A0AA51RVT4_9GAMM|nr:hypothetical protein [Pleionea sp. HL-JVS1]WMS88429.1 hypothetical protein Q9312_05815 [Pleionea sp. HL-JVS1]